MSFESIGPWGGQDGFRWDDGVYSTVRKLVIAHGAGIYSIQIEYDKKGTSIWSEKHGGSGGNRIDKVKLDYPNEFLTSVHGHYGRINHWGPVLIRSLTFESNKRTYGPFGVEQGKCFSSPLTGGKIVGFHGRSGWCLNAIGIYFSSSSSSSTSDDDDDDDDDPRSNKPVVTEEYISLAMAETESELEVDKLTVVTKEGHARSAPCSNKPVVAKRGQAEDVAYGVIEEPGPWDFMTIHGLAHGLAYI